MPAELHIFEYAVVRVVPRVEREEFCNVGVILFCAAQGFLRVITELPEAKLRALAGADGANLDLADLADRLHAFTRICGGRAQGGPIGQLAASARFRWLTAARSTLVQTSAAHPGRCTDAEATLARLFAELVA